MSRQVSFAAVPPLPTQGESFVGYAVLGAVRENVEILTGARGTTGKAVLRGDITVGPPPVMKLTQLGATGASINIGGVSVPRAEEYFQLVRDVQTLANDVAQLRETVAALVNQLQA